MIDSVTITWTFYSLEHMIFSVYNLKHGIRSEHFPHCDILITQSMVLGFITSLPTQKTSTYSRTARERRAVDEEIHYTSSRPS
jgi:hypothetical protein